MNDDECAGLGDGRCEAEGVCSGLDESCASGRRYAKHGGALGGECVPATGETTGDPTTGTSSTATLTTDPSLDTGGSSTAPSTTLDFDTTSAVDDEGTSTGGGQVKCIHDSFERSDLVDDLCEYSDDGVDLDLRPDGTLRFTLDPDTADGTDMSEFGNVRTCGRTDWRGADASVQVIAASTMPNVQTYIDFATEDEYVGLVVLDGSLVHYSLIGGEWQEHASEPYAASHRWFRIVHVPSNDTVESWVSPNGADWVPFGTSAGFGIIEHCWIEIGMGAEPLPPTEVEAVFDDLDVCAAPQ